MRRAARLLGRFLLPVLLLPALLLTPAFAADTVRSVTSTYTAETVVNDEVVCPALIPGPEDGSVIVRWVSSNHDPVYVHFGPGDGSEPLSGSWSCVEAEAKQTTVFSTASRLYIWSATLALEPGEYLYGLSGGRREAPETLYPLRWRMGDTFRVVLTADSHLSNGKQAALHEEAVLACSGDQGADLVLHAGDVNENTKSFPFVITHDTASSRSIPFAAVAGNHDRDRSLYAYLMPPNQDEKTGDYWFIMDNVLFVGLNIWCNAPVYHADYVSRIVPEHRADCDWVVVMIHYSMMGDGAHAHDPVVVNTRIALEPVFSETDVDLVLSGHDHEYDRSYLIGPDGMVEDTGGRSVEKHAGETLYLSLPTATGTKFYKRVKSPLYPLAVSAMKFERGVAVADFSPGGVTVRVLNLETGVLEDQFLLTRADG